MRRKYFILIFISIIGVAFSINPKIIKNPDSPYFYGEAESEELNEAKDDALSALSKNISVMVSSSFENYAKEKNGKVTESCESIINTYSTIALRNLKPYKKATEDGWYVLYYIHRDSLNAIYRERVRLIGDMYSEAREMEEFTNLSGALQQYYYCLILMDSVPFSDINFKNENLRTKVPAAIKRILNNVKFVYEGDKKPQKDQRFVKLGIYYNEKPVSKLDFSYIEKNDEYKTIAKNGKAFCQLTGASVNYTTLEIKIQYSFGAKRSQYTVVNQLWKAVKRKKFPENKHIVELVREENILNKKETIKNNNAVYNFNIKNPDNCDIKEKILSNTISLLNSFSGKNNTDINMTDDFKNKLKNLIKYNHPLIVDSNYNVLINKTYEGWELRKIPLYCNYPTLNKQTTEYAILDFDKTGKLIDINFSVFNQLYNSYVLNNSNPEDKIHKQIIIKFIEKYRTAFLNRDIETIKTIFADEAVIIVGKIKKAKKQIKDFAYRKLSSEQCDLEYIKLTKQQYIKRQKQIFESKQDIHLGFNTFKVTRKSAGSNVYGVAMRQQYTSSGYSDEGHLFLLIDFDGKEPMIYVRSWQPQEWRDDQIIQLGNFKMIGNK